MKATLKNRDLSQGGFTLLEVLVALAIIGISLVVLLQTQSANMTRVYHAASLTKAAILGQKIIAEMDSGKTVTAGEWEGEEIVDDVSFFWEKRVEPSVVSNLVRVTVSVRWGKESSLPYVIETYRAL